MLSKSRRGPLSFDSNPVPSSSSHDHTYRLHWLLFFSSHAVPPPVLLIFSFSLFLHPIPHQPWSRRPSPLPSPRAPSQSEGLPPPSSEESVAPATTATACEPDATARCPARAVLVRRHARPSAPIAEQTINMHCPRRARVCVSVQSRKKEERKGSPPAAFPRSRASRLLTCPSA